MHLSRTRLSATCPTPRTCRSKRPGSSSGLQHRDTGLVDELSRTHRARTAPNLACVYDFALQQHPRQEHPRPQNRKAPKPEQVVDPCPTPKPCPLTFKHNRLRHDCDKQPARHAIMPCLRARLRQATCSRALSQGTTATSTSKLRTTKQNCF